MRHVSDVFTVRSKLQNGLSDSAFIKQLTTKSCIFRQQGKNWLKPSFAVPLHEKVCFAVC